MTTTTLFSRLETAIRSAAAESRRLFTEEFGEIPNNATIGGWDEAAWTEDYVRATNDADVETLDDNEYGALLAAWREVFFA